MLVETVNQPPASPERSQAFRAYKDTLLAGGTVDIRATPDIAAWLRDRHMALLTTHHTFEQIAPDLWRFTVGRPTPGKPMTLARMRVEGMAAGERLVLNEPLTRVRAAASNVTRATGRRFRVRALDEGGVEVVRAGEDGELPELPRQGKYGLQAMAAGETKTLPPGTLVDQVRSVAQYEQRRYGRRYSVSRAKDGTITITRTA